MWQLYILILILLIISVNSSYNKCNSKIYCILSFIILGFMIIFRDMSIGNDTSAYEMLFWQLSDIDNINNYTGRYEIGFIKLCKYLNYIVASPRILLVFSGLLVAVAFGRFIYKYSDMPYLSVIMFITLQFFDLSMSGIRQIIAISILVFAFDFMVNRKLMLFALTTGLAASIHSSTISFLLLYPISKLKCNKKLILIMSIMAIIGYLSFDYIVIIIGKLFPVYETYFLLSGNSYSNEPKLATILLLSLWMIIFGIGYYINNLKQSNNYQGKTSKHKTIENIEEICIITTIVMLFFALKGTILIRYKYIFSFVVLIYYPNAIAKLNNKCKIMFELGSLFVLILYISIIYIYRPEWQSTFPYVLCWK